jgi:hypothetical protein
MARDIQWVVARETIPPRLLQRAIETLVYLAHNLDATASLSPEEVRMNAVAIRISSLFSYSTTNVTGSTIIEHCLLHPASPISLEDESARILGIVYTLCLPSLRTTWV